MSHKEETIYDLTVWKGAKHEKEYGRKYIA